MRVQIICCLLLAFAPTFAIAQTRPPSSKTQPKAPVTTPPIRLDSKAEHISVGIDLLSNIKKAVVQSRKGQESATYKAIGIRFSQCSVLYAVLSKTPSSTSSTASELGNAGAVMSLLSGFLYPDGLERYKLDVDWASAEILKMVEVKDERKTFYILRNCQDFWRPDISIVVNAISEVMLPTTR